MSLIEAKTPMMSLIAQLTFAYDSLKILYLFRIIVLSLRVASLTAISDVPSPLFGELSFRPPLRFLLLLIHLNEFRAIVVFLKPMILK